MKFFQTVLLGSALFLGLHAQAEDLGIYTIKCELTLDMDEKLMKMPGVSYNKDAFNWTIDTKTNRAFNWGAQEFYPIVLYAKGVMCIPTLDDKDFKFETCINRFDGSFRQFHFIKNFDFPQQSLRREGICAKVETRNFPKEKF